MKFTKFLALTLCLIMVLGMLPITAGAAEIVDSGYCGGEGDGTNLTWTLTSDGTLTISGTGEMKDLFWSHTPWKNHSESITEIVIEEGVTTISDTAFRDCENCEGAIIIPSTVIDIGFGAFSGCYNVDAYYFVGNAPAVSGSLNTWPSFPVKTPEVILYYIPETTGWTDGQGYSADSGTWCGYKIQPWASNSASNSTAEDIKVGDFLTFGTFNNQPILWQVVDTQDGKLKIFAANNIFAGQIDARNDFRVVTPTMAEGESNWHTSDIRQYLNSDNETVTYKNDKPNYGDLPGFLTNFSNDEKSIIIETRHKSLVHYNSTGVIKDGGSTYAQDTFFTGSNVDSFDMDAYNDLAYLYTSEKVFIPDYLDWLEMDKNDIGIFATYSYDTISGLYEFKGNYSHVSRTPIFIVMGLSSRYFGMYYLDGAGHARASDVVGIRPMCYIQPSSTQKLNGCGTLESPYSFGFGSSSIEQDNNGLKIIEQSPENECTLTPTGNKTVISMTFNHEIESVQTGISFDNDNNIIVHGDFSIVRQIEESDDWEFETVYSLSADNNEETDVTVDGNTVCFDISDAELILGETYYVLMDTGVISFKNTDEKIGFSGTEWTFTVSGNKNGTFRYKAQYGITEYPYSYDDSWFSGETTEYNHDLAKLSLRAAIAAYGTGSNSDGSEYILEFMTDELGFHNLDVYYPTPQRNSIGYAIGSKTIPSEDSEDGKKSLILVAIRGGGYGTEWGGNFMIGTGNFKDGIAGDLHEGFSRAADQVAYGLESYIRWQKSEGHLSDDCVVWIVGYSRAAATANLLAKYLDDGNVEDISKENVFAYCFECPQNSRATDLNNIKYDNIMNIVNPIDFVTMVAMDEWNYGRYGQTFYLPYVEGAENYDDLSDKMAKCYTEIIESGTGVNDVWLATRQLKGQLDMTNGLMNWLADTFYSPEIYTALYQEALIECVEAGVRGELLLKDCPALAIMLIKLGLIAKDTFSIPNPMEEPLDFIDAVSSSIDNIYAAWAIESLVLEFSSSKDFSKTYLTYAHYPELCLAWMDSLSGSNSFVSNKYRKVFINCPVDVFVYDSSNTLVSSVVDRAVQEINNGISIYIDGNEQIVISLPVTEEYIIEIKATDTGTVTYTVTEHNVETNASERVVSYQELIIDKDDLLIGTIENLAKTDSAKYPFTHNGDEQNPTVDQKGNQVVYHSVICTIEGNGVVNGGGGALHGEYRKLIATPDENESFIGWYVDDKLVSSESEYRFLVAADTVLTAKFTGTKKAPESFLVTGAAYDVKSIDKVDSILYGAFESAEVTDGVDSYVVQKTDGSIPVIAEIMFGVDSNTAATEFENGTYINYQNVFDVDNAMYNPSGNMGLYTNLIYADKDAETDELTAFSPANTVNWKLAEGEIEAKSEEITLESGKLTLDDSTEVYLYIYYPNEDMYNVTTFTGHERLPSLTVDYDGYGVVNCYGVPNESDSGVAGIVVFEIKTSSDSEGEPVYPEEDDSCFGDIIDFMPGVIALIAASEDEENKTVKEESSSIQMYVDTFPFADVSSADWYYDNVRYAYYNHIMSGVTDTLFAPDSTLTRGMVAQMLYNMEGQPDMTANNPFTDVSDSAWYKNAVAWAASNSIVNGYGDGRFGPEDDVTREQLAAILYRYAQYKGMAAVTMEENLLAFADQAEISEYAVSAMNWAVGKGLISGLPNSILDPKGNATRAQAAAIIHRLCLSGSW